jgi:hypothetical protein
MRLAVERPNTIMSPSPLAGLVDQENVTVPTARAVR